MKEYDKLTEEQKIRVTKMYSYLGDLREYLYNFDKNGYHGRTPIVKEEEVERPRKRKKK